MIIDPNQFKIKAAWPPKADIARIGSATDYIDLYQGGMSTYRILYPKQIANLERERGFSSADQLSAVLPAIQINLFKKLSRYWSQMLYSSPPVIDLGSDEANTALKPYMNQIYQRGGQVALDASRTGTGVLAVSADSTGNPVIRRIDSRYWFPLVDPADQSTVIGDIIAVPYVSDPADPNKTDAFPDRLRVTKLIVGLPTEVQTFILSLGGSEIGVMTDSAVGDILTQRAVIGLVNGVESEHYGESDYPDVIPIVAELNRRHSGISKVLDRHTTPHLAGPRAALQLDSNGNVNIDTINGQYFPVEEGDIVPQYVTWDANLIANTAQVESMLYQFYVMSDTSSAAFGIQGDGNSVESGAALRKLLFSSFLRLGSLRRTHSEAITSIVTRLIPGSNVTITWPESFTDGMTENATTESIRLASGTTTREDAIARLDNVGKSEAKRIAALATPTPTPAPESNNE